MVIYLAIINNEYWRQRIEAEMLAKQQREGDVDVHLQALYQHHFTNIEREIQLFYQRYADVNGIDIAEAKKRASEMDVRFFADKARRYVEEKNFSPEANKELALYNLKMKVSRAELLQYHIDLELLALTNGEHQLAERFLSQAYVDELKAQAGILGESLVSSETLKHKAEALLNVPYEGATWSSRIWRRQGELRLYVAKLAHETLVRGRSSLTMISTIRKQMNVSKASAKRLVVTETARLQTQAQKDVYLANEFEEYEYIAEPSACPICKALDGKTFKVKSMEPGENASPMHPHCHCSTAPFVDREKFWSDMEKSLKGVENTSKKMYTKNILGATHGALNDYNDPSGEKRYQHAKNYYESVRKRNKDIEITKISKNTGFRFREIETVYNHVFIQKHDLLGGFKRFDPSYDMAESWRRLREGKQIFDHDIMLLEHEFYEATLMMDGQSYQEAHDKTNKIYNYQFKLLEWLEERGG